jgi:hypothetical protein
VTWRVPRRRRVLLGSLVPLLVLGWLAERGFGRRFWYPYYRAMAGSRTRDEVLREVRPRHRPALEQAAREAGLRYPPSGITLVGLKQERLLEVWASKGRGWTLLRSYPVLAASGGPGPKLRQGDLQVPEGIYRLTHLNPDSSYHLSIRVDYPNAFDRARGRQDGRGDLGGDIYIHGKAVSIGCLALGDAAIEELFTLVADVGLARSRIVLAPGASPEVPPGSPPWLGGLYRQVRVELGALGRETR